MFSADIRTPKKRRKSIDESNHDSGMITETEALRLENVRLKKTIKSLKEFIVFNGLRWVMVIKICISS